MGDESAPYVLASEAEWCGGRFELETERPLGRSYRLHCPACKQLHDFKVQEQ